MMCDGGGEIWINGKFWNGMEKIYVKGALIVTFKVMLNPMMNLIFL